MLTRLKVTGFKNLVDVDVHFGPFTCIAGANGVGKSNLFDAIRFLSALADRTFVDAAKSVRDEGGRTGDIRALFHRVGEKVAERMTFEAEMIIPPEGVDDLGQTAKANTTFLSYTVELGYRPAQPGGAGDSLELWKENLTYIPRRDWQKRLRFPCESAWVDTAIHFSDRRSPFISTKEVSGERRVLLHRGDGGAPGKTTQRSARQLPRTVLSATNAYESPTALLARREMQSWQLLQLEPTSLRKPDEFVAPARLGADGSHLPATLSRLDREAVKSSEPPVYDRVAGRLQSLIEDVRTIRVDRDEKRELLSLIATDRHNTPLPARALSDGTLRFLALTVLELDPEALGVICFEEPENGIHPDRIPAMLQLLQDIAVDTVLPVAADNPLRQVIVNTHSPLVVQQIDRDDFLAAMTQEAVQNGVRYQNIVFQSAANTWRCSFPEAPEPIAPGMLASYLKTGFMSPSRHTGTNGKAPRASKPGQAVPKQLSLFDSIPDDE